MIDMNSGKNDAVVDRVFVMLRQEEGDYRCRFIPDDQASSFGDEVLSPKWREKICQWSYNVVDQ